MFIRRVRVRYMVREIVFNLNKCLKPINLNAKNVTEIKYTHTCMYNIKSDPVLMVRNNGSDRWFNLSWRGATTKTHQLKSRVCRWWWWWWCSTNSNTYIYIFKRYQEYIERYILIIYMFIKNSIPMRYQIKLANLNTAQTFIIV